jgi:hypothetical protein
VCLGSLRVWLRVECGSGVVKEEGRVEERRAGL